MNGRNVAIISLVLAACGALCAAAEGLVDAGEPFGELPLVDEVLCGGPVEEGRPFAEGPGQPSRVETILGAPCRVLPAEGEAKFFAYRLGRGKGLKAGAPYVLSIEFPDDRPRTMFLMNRGAEMSHGVYTGAALGDTLYGYTNNNAESLAIPLSGKMQTWKTLFFLHDRFPDLAQPRGEGDRPHTPEDGFWVIVAQAEQTRAPLSAGAAVARIRLFAVPDPAKFHVRLRLPPQPLPRRRLFWREEMADGVIGSRNEQQRGLKNETDWFEFKARLMQFLGLDTFCKDLLEFGHNQGWGCPEGPSGQDWYYQSKTPQRWAQILEMLRPYGFDVLPYYEYAGGTGAKGLGRQKRCITLGGGNTYTHITWSEKFNLDVTDPESLGDAKKLLDFTIVRHKDVARFVGAWFRTRPSNMPMSFSDDCLLLFSDHARRLEPVTREELKRDPRLLEEYRAWWFQRRRDFLVALRDHLRASASPDAVILFTPDGSEPGRSLPGFGRKVVTDDPATWEQIARDPAHKEIAVARYEDVLAKDLHLQALLSPPGTWAQWEWQHSLPQADPANYAQTDGVLMTYSFSRAYSVSSAKAFDAFRTAGGLAAVKHLPLNENVAPKELGYFVCDMERCGPYSLLAEARAVAYGDPRYIGFLVGGSFNRGFPQYARRFHAAFLALPALPSKVLDGAASSGDVVVRSIPTDKHGVYLAVVNVGLEDRPEVTIRLPAAGKVTDAATGEALEAPGGTVRLALGACELRALHIAP